MATDLVKQYLNYAKPYADKYKLDPYAMLAVAHAESGLNPGSIGDSGSSFGYHQLHIGGALGNMNSSQARQYLDPKRNLETAARLMAKAGASGLSGKEAINAMVRFFERPANPGGEVNRAWDFYQSARKGARMIDPGMAAPVMQTPGQIPDPVGDSRSMLMNYLMARNDVRETPNEQTMNLLGLIRAQQAPVTASSQPSTMGQPPYAGMPGGAKEPVKGPSETFSGSYPLGKRGNLIGTPYGGTHNLGNWQSDNAIDLSAPMGTPIIAVADGVIGSRFGSLGAGKGSRFAGLRMTLEGKGNSYYYAHLSRFAGGIKPGARVKRGQVIGYSGSANGVTHLHLGVEHGNPLDIFKLR